MTACDRLQRLLRHEPVDRLPICPIGLSPYTWHKDFPAYRPVLEVAAKHCEFTPVYYLQSGVNYCLPQLCAEQATVEKQASGRQIKHTTLMTPRGPLTSVAVHDPEIGSWALSKPYVANEELAHILQLRTPVAFPPDECWVK